MDTRLVAAALMAATVSSASIARAETYNLNVCEVLVEDLWIPPTISDVLECRDFSLWECGLLPHCCVPGVCLTDPVCTEVVPKILQPGYWIHAGDVYCDVRDISGEELVEKWLRGQIANIDDLLPMVLDTVLLHVEAMKLAAAPLRQADKELLLEITSPFRFNGTAAYGDDQLDNVRIISGDAPTASLYLNGDAHAITLGSLVIIKDVSFQTLVDAQNSFSLDEVQQGAGTSGYLHAIEVMNHELVHVRQYDDLGEDVFINNYLLETALRGYGNDSFEQEAYTYGATVAKEAGGRYCEEAAWYHEWAIESFDLPVTYGECAPYVSPQSRQAALILAALSPLL
jgi:hypothetical protein